METTYTVLGTDGKQYGPITLENLQTWIREGRVTAETQILRSDLNVWYPAGQYSELGLSGAPTAPAGSGPRVAAQTVRAASPTTVASANPSTAAMYAGELEGLEKRIKGGASWFYWIAAFSLINSVVAMTSSEYGFFLGLSLTQLVDVAAKNAGAGAGIVGLVVGVLAAGALVMFGVFAHRRQTWAFVVGTVLYGLDSLLTVVFALVSGSLWIGVAIHAWALFSLIVGLKANLDYNKLTRAA